MIRSNISGIIHYFGLLLWLWNSLFLLTP